MNAPTTATLTEVQQIERSLDEILTAIIEHDRRPRVDDGGTYRLYSVADLARAFEENRARTPAGRFAHALAEEGAVRASLTHAVRQLGKRLHEIGGLQAMQDACDRVAELHPESWGYRTNIMDKRWDGIGRDAKNAGWCA